MVLMFNASIAWCQRGSLSVSEKPTSFSVFNPSSVATLYTDAADAKVVTIAATALVNDVQLISGKKMVLSHAIPQSGYTIIAGTIGKSKVIDELIKSKQIDVSQIKDKWECYTIKVIGNKLLIAGSDRRGTATPALGTLTRAPSAARRCATTSSATPKT